MPTPQKKLGVVWVPKSLEKKFRRCAPPGGGPSNTVSGLYTRKMDKNHDLWNRRSGCPRAQRSFLGWYWVDLRWFRSFISTARGMSILEPARWAWLAPKAFLTCPKLPNLLTNTNSFGFLVIILAHNTGPKRLNYRPETVLDGPPPGGAHLPKFFSRLFGTQPTPKNFCGVGTRVHAPQLLRQTTIQMLEAFITHQSSRSQCAFTSQSKAPSAR